MIAGQLEIQLMANVARIAADMDQAKRSVTGAMAGIEQAAAMAQRALGALGVGLSAGALVAFTKSVIDATAKLDDMAEITGATVESLSALRQVARVSGQEMDGVAGAMTKLAKNLAGVDDESRGAGQALKAIGLDLDAVKKLKADEQMQAIAKAMGQFEDGTGKAAVAQVLFGKSGAALLPFLKDLAEWGQLNASVTAKQAAEAEQAQKAWNRLKSDMHDSAAVTINELVPMLTAVAGDLMVLQKESTGAAGSFSPLTEAFRAALILGGNVGFVLHAVGVEIGGMAAQIALLAQIPFAKSREEAKALFAQFSAIGEMMKKDAEQSRASFDAWEKKILSLGTATAADAAKTKEAAKARLEFSSATDKAGDSAKKAAEEFGKLMNRINAKVAGVDPGYLHDVELLAAGYARGALTADEFHAALAKLNSQQKYATDAEAARKKALEETARAEEAARKAVADRLRTLEDATRAAEEEVENYGLTKSAIELNTIARLEEARAIVRKHGATVESLAALDEEIALRKRLATAMGQKDVLDANKKAAEDSAREWQKITDDVNRALTDAIMRGGKSGLEHLKSYAKTYAIRVMVEYATNAAGNALGFGGQGGAGGIGNLLSIGSNAYNVQATGLPGYGGGMIGTNAIAGIAGVTGNAAWGAGFANGAAGSQAAIQSYWNAAELALAEGTAEGQALALSMNEAAAGLEAGAAAAEGILGTLSAAAPYVAAALAIASMLDTGGGGPKSGGDAGFSYANGAWSQLPDTGLAYTPADANAQVQSVLQPALAGIQTMVAKLGGAADALSGQFILGFDSDPQGTAGNRITSVVGDQNLSINRQVGDVQSGMAEEVVRMTVAALRQVDLADWADALVASVDPATASIEQLTGVLGQLTAFTDAEAAQKALIESLKTDAERLADAQQALTAAGLGTTADDWTAMATALDLTTEAGQAQLAEMVRLRGALDFVTRAADEAARAADEAAQRQTHEAARAADEAARAAAEAATTFVDTFVATVTRSIEHAAGQFSNALSAWQETIGAARSARDLFWTLQSDARRVSDAGAASLARLADDRGQQRLAAIVADWGGMSAAEQVAAMDELRGLVLERYDFEAQAIRETEAAQRQTHEAARAAAREQQAAYARQADDAERLADRWTDLARGVHDYLSELSLSAAGGLSEPERLSEARRQLSDLAAAGMSGDEAAFGRIGRVADTYLDLFRTQAATAIDYAIEVARVRGEMGTLADAADVTGGEQDRLARSLAHLADEQQDIADSAADTAQSAAELARIQDRALAELGALDGLLTNVQLGLVNSVQTQEGQLITMAGVLDGLGANGAITQAIAALPADLARVLAGAAPTVTAAAASVPSSGSSYSVAQINSYIDAVLAGAGSDQEKALTIYATARATNTTAAQIAAAMGLNEADLNAWATTSGLPQFEVGTSYVPYDMTAQIHAGEEITPRPYVDMQRAARDETNALLDRLLRSNDTLRAEVAELRAAANKSAAAAEAQESFFRRISPDGNSITVTVAA